MIRATLDKVFVMRRRERLHREMSVAFRSLDDCVRAVSHADEAEYARLRRRALVIEALEMRRIRR